jgi:purine-nucleoside phosphorylase
MDTTNTYDGYLNLNASFNKEFTYEKVKFIADWLLERTEIRPKIAIICGSGLSGLGDRLSDIKVFPYSIVPYFPQATGILSLNYESN